jgi:hypothetical protein
MKISRGLLMGMALLLLPLAALGQVIPISDVNADDQDGFPILNGQVVTVRGVVTVWSRALSDSTNDFYIEDATGGLNIIQPNRISPAVAQGDSVRVTGAVAVNYGNRTYVNVDAEIVPGSRIVVLNRGNPIPDPVVVTPRMLATSEGEVFEGIYAVVRRVTLPYPSQWPSGSCSPNDYKATYIADSDTMCRLWFDTDTDFCGSPAPLDTFDVYGVVIPRPKTVSSWRGHGILPPARSYILSRGPGSGFAQSSVDRVFANRTVDIGFTITGEADVLTRIAVSVPEGFVFSGDTADVTVSGPGMAGASVVADSTTSGLVTVSGCAVAHEISGTVTLHDVRAPGTAGSYPFDVATAPADRVLVAIADSPEIAVDLLAEPGTILINEIYAHTNDAIDTKDRGEFIELYNPGEDPVDISGWVLTDLNNAGACGGANLWAFPTSPRTIMEPGEYVVVTKDAWTNPPSGTQGFIPVFKDSVDWETLKIFEMVDHGFGDHDWTGNATYPDVPNMSLVSPLDDDNQTSQEIRLLGGFDQNGPLVAGEPAADAVYLYSDQTRTALVDAMEYRNPVFLRHDYCPTEQGLGGPDDAYVPGPPPNAYSLGRGILSTDTNNSSADFTLSAWPTPGAVNRPVDHKPPIVKSISTAGSTFMLVKFSEPLDPEEAVDTSHYSVEGLSLHEAWLSRDGRTVLLQTDGQTPDHLYAVSVSGVTDAAGNTMVPVEQLTMSGFYLVETPIGEIQAWDEMGYSPLWGQNASVVGFTTVPPGVFQPDRTNMYVQDLDGWGLNVYVSDLLPSPPLEGDLVLAQDGLILEYRSVDSANPWAVPPGSSTEISGPAVTVLARGFDVIQPLVLPTGEVGSERNEGVLVKTSGVVTTLQGFAFFIDDGSGSCQIYQNFSDLDFSKYAVGDSVEATGVLLQYDYTQPYFGGYELAPRYSEDIVQLAVHYTADASIETSAKVLDINAGESIDISFNAERSSRVTIRIFDLKGRSIATLYDGLCLGSTRATWDGRDDAGRKVPVGVYICHIQARPRGGETVKDAAVPIVVGSKLD